MTGRPGGQPDWNVGGVFELIVTAIAGLLAGSVPAVVGYWSSRRKTAADTEKSRADAKQIAIHTTRDEFEALYKEMRAQLEDARRGWAACRSECTSLRISLDLEEQKTEALEDQVQKLAPLQEQVRMLEARVAELQRHKGRR